MLGEGGSKLSANEYNIAHGAQINFGDLAPYLTYVYSILATLYYGTVKIGWIAEVRSCGPKLTVSCERGRCHIYLLSFFGQKSLEVHTGV
jgi:hypothetical protein